MVNLGKNKFNLGNNNPEYNNVTTIINGAVSITSSQQSICPSPLVPTFDSNLWFNSTKGCSLPCKNPIYNQSEHLKLLIFWLSLTSFISTLISLWYFHGKWFSPQKCRMARTLFRYHLCLCLMSFGWFLQFLPSLSELPCQPNNTIIYGLTFVGPPPCIISFLLTYYVNLVATVWFIYYSYISYGKIVKDKKLENNKIPQQVSLFAWSGPFIAVIFIAFFEQIDGNSLYGICFVGQKNPLMRLIFYNLPLTFSLIGVYYLVRVLNKLQQPVEGDKPLNGRGKKRSERGTRSNQRRIITLIAMITLHAISSNSLWFYEFFSYESWSRALMELIPCSVGSPSYQNCDKGMNYCIISSHPNMTLYCFEIIGLFGQCLAVVYLILNDSNLTTIKKRIISYLDDYNENENDLDRVPRSNIERKTVQRNPSIATRGSLDSDVTCSEIAGVTSRIRKAGQRFSHKFSQSYINHNHEYIDNSQQTSSQQHIFQQMFAPQMYPASANGMPYQIDPQLDPQSAAAAAAVAIFCPWLSVTNLLKSPVLASMEQPQFEHIKNDQSDIVTNPFSR